MGPAFMRLIALCMLAAVSEQLTGGSKLRDGVRLIVGILAAQLILETIYALPGALFS